MPIPNPKSGQSQEDYMGVCMTFMDNEKSKYPEHKQRVAICLETYRRNESDDLLKRLDLMINDTTATGDVAMPQGQVMGMQYRKKKKKAKGGASYDVHESKDDVVASLTHIIREREGKQNTGQERGQTSKTDGHKHDYFFDRLTGDGSTGVPVGKKTGHLHKIKAMVVVKSEGHTHNLR